VIDTDVEEVMLSVVIPGFNEQQSIRLAIETCRKALDHQGISHEILIVDDASTDGTGAIADALAATDPAVRVIHNPINLNVGASILIGYRAARGRLVTHNAMDLPFDPSDLHRILPRFDDPSLAMVVVARIDRSAHSVWRKVTSIVHHWIVRTLFLVDVSDMNFVQVVRRSVANELGVRARSPAFVTPEMIIRARRAGVRMEEVEAVFHHRKVGKGHFGKPRDILWALADIASFWLEGRGLRSRRLGR
jgi:glycosyltransferase involved in cell wall biosynthesis